MSDGSERRQHPRRVSRQDVFCYIDGNRFDACSEDLSAGGMFLRTDGRVEVAVGTIVGLVAGGFDASDQPVRQRGAAHACDPFGLSE